MATLQSEEAQLTLEKCPDHALPNKDLSEVEGEAKQHVRALSAAADALVQAALLGSSDASYNEAVTSFNAASVASHTSRADLARHKTLASLALLAPTPSGDAHE